MAITPSAALKLIHSPVKIISSNQRWFIKCEPHFQRTLSPSCDPENIADCESKVAPDLRTKRPTSSRERIFGVKDQTGKYITLKNNNNNNYKEFMFQERGSKLTGELAIYLTKQ